MFGLGFPFFDTSLAVQCWQDFHRLRVTWVTLALKAGVPFELLQKVTGKKTTDIVLKHYFQPGCEDFRQALHSAMPKLLTNGHKTAKEEMREARTPFFGWHLPGQVRTKSWTQPEADYEPP